jgi:hypothetical protein
MKILDNLVTKILCNPTIQKAVEKRGIAFLVEFITRFLSKNPAFFNVINWVSFGIATLTGLPETLVSYGIAVPSWLAIFENHFALVASVIVLIIGQLPVQPKVVGISDITDKPLKQPADATRPFTAISETIQANKVVTMGKGAANANP